MRLLLAAVAFLIALPVQAQTPRYRPLDVGNTWTYNFRSTQGPQNDLPPLTLRYHQTVTIVGDTLGGRVLTCRRVSPAGAIVGSARYTVSLPEESALTITLVSGANCSPPWTSNVPTGGQVLPDTLKVSGILYTVAGSRYQVAQGGNGNNGGVSVQRFVADIGQVQQLSRSWTLGSESYSVSTLTHAIVGGQEYGDPLIVAAEPLPGGAAALAVTAAPNPTRGTATLRLSLPEAGAVRVEAYDVTGRRVYAADMGAQPAGASTHALDTGAWAPGVYVVRVAAADGRSASARLVRSE